MLNRVQNGELLGNYLVERRLGEGGFAEVYLGEHRFLKRPVAIKVLTTPLTGEGASRFLREAQTLANLEHTHIVRCYDFGMEHGMAFLVMEYACGGTLRDRHPEGTSVPLDSVISYVQQVAAALQYMHDRGLIHLDIKPENMLLNRQGEVLLSDFDLARFTRSLSTTTKSLVGTISYMAPEQLRRGKPGPASDQYALATVVYEWLVGAHPFASDDAKVVAAQHLTEVPASLRTVVPTMPPAVDAVVLAALAKAPEDRYASVIEFAEALSSASQLGSAATATEQLALRPGDLNTLFREGLAAKVRGDLERAERLLTQVHTRAPSFREVLEDQLQQVRQQRRSKQIEDLNAQAEAANRVGAWQREIEIWTQLLRFDPSNVPASKRLQLARVHQRFAPLYEDAHYFSNGGNLDCARDLLRQLWARDRYYSDPGGLGRRLKMRVPLTYQEEQARLAQAETRREKQELAKERRTRRVAFAQAAYGPRLGRLWLVWLSCFLLLDGGGAVAGALSQSWPLALLALLLTATASWRLGYRRALDLPSLAALLAFACALSLALTLSFAHFNYAHVLISPHTATIPTGFFTFKEVTEYHYLFPVRQLLFGVIGGFLIALAGTSIAIGIRPPWGKGSSVAFYRSSNQAPSYLSASALLRIAGGTALAGVFVWLMIASIAAINGWGFGFDLGITMAWRGLGIGGVLGIGVGASVPIWWTAVKA